MDDGHLAFEERDKAGNVVVSYVASKFQKRQNHVDVRVDVIRPVVSRSFPQKVLDAFLPAGYPHSVTDDYLPYQIYDSLQAFASSIAGLLASRAVLEGVGVGDANASPTAALLLSIVQESMGRLATILFAHRLGTTLEPECKRFRLLADVFNDIAMVMDCLSPGLPRVPRVLTLSVASMLRALCGVAAGSSKASLSAHFARWGNLGELNAKDSSQETVISLVGMLAGSVVVSRVSTPLATWTVLLVLLAAHLATNYAAVRAVKMVTLNRQRANILFSTLVDTGRVLSPAEVSREERIFERDGLLRWRSEVIGRGYIGITFQEILKRLSVDGRSTAGAFSGLRVEPGQLLAAARGQKSIVWFSARSESAFVVLREGASAADQLTGWVAGLLTARALRDKQQRTGDEEMLEIIAAGMARSQELVQQHRRQMEEAGWDVGAGTLETGWSVRLWETQPARVTGTTGNFAAVS